MMRGRFNYEVLSYYPHMSEAEAAIWSRFIRTCPDVFDSVDYDVVVGDPRESEEALGPEWERNRNYLGKAKIDAVAYNDSGICIIEVKKEAWVSALGEVWLYEHLYMRDYPTDVPIRLLVITETERPHVREVLEKDGVLFEVV